MRKTLLAALFLAFCPLLVAQQPLNNDAVIKMAKAGLSDDVIITSINANPGSYDTSTDGLVALKKAKVSDKVVSAIIVKSANGGPPAAAPTLAPIAPGGFGGFGAPAAPSAAVPSGIDGVGIYYQDPTAPGRKSPPRWSTSRPEARSNTLQPPAS